MARVKAVVYLSNVVMDRWPITPVTLALVDHLRAHGWGSVPPIHVKPNGRGQLTILDGRHRVAAHKLLGWTTIVARYHYVKGTHTTVSSGSSPQADGYSQTD